MEWQLKEKETKAQLQEVDERLKRERHAQMSQPLEPKKLLSLLPALRDWLRSLKKVRCNAARIGVKHRRLLNFDVVHSCEL